MTCITGNLSRVYQRIGTAARAAGRDAEAITLVAVSKRHSAARVKQARRAGQLDFGENQLGEAVDKILSIDDESIIWHFIGTLQSNKTAGVARHFRWVHSVDRQKIATRLNGQRGDDAPRLNVCIQVKLVEEPGKGGVASERLVDLASHIAGLPRLRLRGLMCIPPPVSDPELQRPRFRRLRELAAMLADQGHELDTLSMGMSADFEIGIEEGANLVRVGTAVFGPRN